MTDVPPLELFLHYRPRGSWAADFVASLERDVPVRAPSNVTRAESNAATGIRIAAKRANKRVALRTVNGEVWVCWIGAAS